MAEFNFFLNRQGIQGRKGEKGDTGFSPTISVGTDTLDEYKLIIANESNSFETPNLRGNINISDNGGTYLRYDTETKQISAQNMDAATADTLGGVRLSTEADIVEIGAGSVVTPSDVADALPLYLEGEGAVTITQDELTSKTKIKVDVPSVNDLESRMSTAEAEIANIQTDVTDLNNNKVAKTDLATTASAGIVKVDGTSITVTGDGTISASPSGALPIASTTQLGGVKVDGTSIIADENGVISSVGGGGTGDVTAGGNNEFTGENTFSKSIRVENPTDPFQRTFVNYNGLGIGTTSEAEIKVQDNQTPMPLKFIASKLTLSNAYDGSSESPIITSDKLKAGENITLNKNAETGDITISSTASGGGGGDVPIATTEVAGKVKPDGTTITVAADGTISATGGSGDVTAAGDNTFTGSNTFNSYVTFNNGFNTTNNAYLRGATFVDNGSHYFQYISDSLSMNMPIKCNNSYVLTQNALVAGDGITLANTSQGVQISANGGGSAPTNMVTTDSDQTINGSKTFANGTGTTFTGTSSNSNSLTIDGDDKEIRFNSENQSPAVIRNQGWSTTDLNIGTNFNSVKITTTLYDKNGNEIVGGGGSTPTNMVTTDTEQIITGAKTFTNSIVLQNTLDMSTSGTDILNINATGSPTQGYTTNINFHKNLNIQSRLSGGTLTLAPNGSGLNALKYKDSSNTSNPSYDILHTGNLVTGNGITISEPNSTGVRTISGPSDVYMAHMAFPSDRYVDLTLGANGSSYTAPADGWAVISKKTSAVNQSVSLGIGNSVRYLTISPTKGGSVSTSLPVRKGANFYCTYSAGGDLDFFRFVYAVGSESGAS